MRGKAQLNPEEGPETITAAAPMFSVVIVEELDLSSLVEVGDRSALEGKELKRKLR